MSRQHQQSPSPEELRAQIVETREELGHTVEALVARVDVKAQAREKAEQARRRLGRTTSHAREQVTGKAAQALAQAEERTLHAAASAQDRAPEPALRAARDNRTVLLAACAAAGSALALWLLLRHRGEE